MIMILTCKSNTTIGIPVGTQCEIDRELWDTQREIVQRMARDGLAWYASLEGAELVGPVKWNLAEPYLFPSLIVDEGVWE